MPHTKEKKPKLTDAERYKRFLDIAKKVEASEEARDLDAAIIRVASKRPPPTTPNQ
jgi:hypothetical protein